MTTNRLEEVKQEHTDLASRVKQAEDRMALVPEMETFLQRLRSAGSEAPLGDERELLSSLASYWAGLIYEYSETGKYPSPELDPYTGTESTMDQRRRRDSATGRSLRVLAGVVITVVLAATALLAGALGHPPFGGWLSRETPTSAVAEATRTQVLVGTLTMISGATATVAIQPTSTPLPATGIDVRLVEPVNGATVLPASILRGIYENLQPGWRIYAILQPLSRTGRLFPVGAPFVVPEGLRSGGWEVDPGFSKRPESRDGERYQIYVSVAIDESASNALRTGAAEGFGGVKELPQAALVFETNTTVGIDAFQEVDEDRLIFSGLSNREGLQDLMTSRPDGSDLRQITRTLELAELDPDLSPDGKTIVYVGKTQVEMHDVYSLQTIESSGSNARTLLEEKSATLRRPKWSPDGRRIAYGAVAQENGDDIWRVYLFDTTTGVATLVSGEATSLRHPSWFPDGEALVLQGWADPSQSYGLFRLDLTTGVVTVLYNTEAQEINPELSDDGRYVAFVSYPALNANTESEICWLDLQSGKAQVSTPVKGLYNEPTWRPDSGSIFFDVGAPGVESIYEIELTDGKPKRIADGRTPDVGHVRAILSAAQWAPVEVGPSQ